MLSFEKTLPHELAYDRLTPKMIKFLSKHYLLNKYFIQNNGFSVYDGYFNNKRKTNNLSKNGDSLLCKFIYAH